MIRKAALSAAAVLAVLALSAAYIEISFAQAATQVPAAQTPRQGRGGSAGDSAAPARKQGDGVGPFKKMVVRGVTLIDGTGGPPLSPMDIVVEGNRITAVRQAGWPGLPQQANREPRAGRLGGANHRVALGRGQGHRFFDQDVNARAQQVDGHRRVILMRNADNRGVDVGNDVLMASIAGRHLELVRDILQAVSRWIGDGNCLHTRGARERRQVDAFGRGSGADYTDTDRSHDVAAFH